MVIPTLYGYYHKFYITQDHCFYCFCEVNSILITFFLSCWLLWFFFSYRHKHTYLGYDWNLLVLSLFFVFYIFQMMLITLVNSMQFKSILKLERQNSKSNFHRQAPQYDSAVLLLINKMAARWGSAELF